MAPTNLPDHELDIFLLTATEAIDLVDGTAATLEREEGLSAAAEAEELTAAAWAELEACEATIRKGPVRPALPRGNADSVRVCPEDSAWKQATGLPRIRVDGGRSMIPFVSP